MIKGTIPFIVTLLVLLANFPAETAVFTAATCNAGDVQAAIDAASDGDTVIAPSGSCTWSNGVTIKAKAIKLTGPDLGVATLTNNAGSADLITLAEATSGRVELTKLGFLQGSGAGRFLRITSTANGRAVLIHDNTFTFTAVSGDAIRIETNRGVIWSNTFTGLVDVQMHTNSALRCKPEVLTASWTTASTMGTDDTTGESNVYFEGNTLTRLTTEALDPDGDCRIVIRYNTFDNSGLSSHGQDTGPQGVRHWEYYNNTFLFTNGGDCNGSRTAPLDYFFFVRGGTGVIADNVIPNIASCSWGDKAEIKMTVMNLRRNAGPYPCWGTTTPGSYPASRQIGQSHDATNYITDPVYIWGNTGGGNYDHPSVIDYVPNECGSSAPSSLEYIVVGRDIVLGTPKPGYAKYPYPHPFASMLPAPSALRVQ